MTEWRPGDMPPPGGWMAGPSVAGIGVRLGAWLVDWGIFGLVGAATIAAAVVAGSVGENPEAAKQLLADPAAQPTVSLLVCKFGEVAAWAALWVAAVTVYPAVCWSRFRGLPGQRLASLDVADAATGRNLPLWRALLRSALLNGIPAGALAVTIVAAVDVVSREPASAYGGSSEELSRLLLSGDWGGSLSIASLVLWIWLPALLVSAAASFRNRGFHDRLGGSVVVRWVGVPRGWPRSSMPPAARQSWGAPAPGAPGAPPPAPPNLSSPPVSPPPRMPDSEAGPGWVRSEESEPVPGRIAGGHRVAPFGRRTGAYILDLLLIFGAYTVIVALVRGSAATTDAPVPERDSMTIGLLTAVTQFVYLVGTWSAVRGSLGQRIAGMLVVRESGDRLSLIDCMARWAVLQGPMALALALPESLLIVGTCAAAVWTALLMSSVRSDPLGRGYHDRIAGSRVILQG